MPMHRKTITITDQQEHWVKAQIDTGRYANDSEYFRDLVRRDQERRQAEAKLGSMIDKAESQGLSDRTPQDVWTDAEKRHAVTNA